MAATIKFGANVTQYVSQVRQAEGATTKFGGAVDKAVAAAAAAFAALTVQATRLSAAFDQQSRIVQNIIGLTDAQRRQIEGLSLELAEYSGAQAEVFLGAAQDALRYGDTIAEVADELMLVAGASNAYGLDAGRLNAVLQKQSNQWGIAEESILAWGAAAGKLAGGDIADLLDRLPNVALAAREVGADFKSVTFLLAGASRQMRNTRKAASGLELLFLELADSQTIASKALEEELGVTFAQLVEQSGGLFGALDQLDATFGSRINDLFGTSGVQAFNAFRAEWDAITSEAEISLDVRTTDLQKDIANSTSSLQEGFNSLAQAWRSFLIEMVDAEGPLKDAVTAITELLQDDDLRRVFADLASAMIDVGVPMVTLAAELAKFAGREIPGTGITLTDAAIAAYAASKGYQLIRAATTGATAAATGAAAGGGGGAGLASRAATAAAGAARGGLGAAGITIAGDYLLEQTTGRNSQQLATDALASGVGQIGDAADRAGVGRGIFGLAPDLGPAADPSGLGILSSMFSPQTWQAAMADGIADGVDAADIADGIADGVDAADIAGAVETGFAATAERAAQTLAQTGARHTAAAAAEFAALPQAEQDFTRFAATARAAQRTTLRGQIDTLLTQGIQDAATGGGYTLGDLSDLHADTAAARTAEELTRIREVLAEMLGVTQDVADHTDPTLTAQTDAVIVAPVRATIPDIYTASN